MLLIDNRPSTPPTGRRLTTILEWGSATCFQGDFRTLEPICYLQNSDVGPFKVRANYGVAFGSIVVTEARHGRHAIRSRLACRVSRRDLAEDP